MMRFILLTSFLVSGAFAEAESDTCELTGSCSPQGQALLQISKLRSVEAMNRSTQLRRKPGDKADPNKVELDAEGYDLIAEQCCLAKMVVFLKRFIEADAPPGLGLEVCHPGALTGFATWNYCASTQGRIFSPNVIDGIKAAVDNNCPWVAMKGQCKEMPPEPTCGRFPDGEMPPCGEEEPCGGKSKDILMLIDASNSVKDKGWKKEVGFAHTLVSAIMGGGNANQHRMNVHWFNGVTAPLVSPTLPHDDYKAQGEVDEKQTEGRFEKIKANNVGSFIGAEDSGGLEALMKLENKLRKLQEEYALVHYGKTDHPQVYFTAETVFEKIGDPSREKIVILITDGETHLGEGCRQCTKKEKKSGACAELIATRQRMPTQDVVEAVIGECRRDVKDSHFCYRGGKKHNTEKSCDMEKCMCGVYRAQEFKKNLAAYGPGAKLIVVGIANGHHQKTFADQMKMIASDEQMYFAPDFNALGPIVAAIHDDLCKD